MQKILSSLKKITTFTNTSSSTDLVLLDFSVIKAMPLKSPFASYHLPKSTAGSYFLRHFKENGDRVAIVSFK